MFAKSKIHAAALLAVGGAVMLPVHAQQAQQLERIEVTGSAIKRIDAETSVPVTIVKMSDLKAQGVTSVEQIMSSLSAVQMNTGSSQQVGAGTVGAAFALIAQDTVCDTNLPDGLLQVLVFNSNRRQVAGASIVITWENGEERFFTGLKPEVGNGDADYSMSPNIVYTVRLASGSDIASELTAPTCQTPSGETFLGGIKLTFEQP